MTFDALAARLRPFRGLGYIAITQFVFSLGFINYFRRSFGHDWQLIPLHLSLVAGFVAGTTILPGLLLLNRTIAAWRATRYLLTVPTVIGWTLLAGLYLVDFVANRWWGGNVNWVLLWQFVPDVWERGWPAWAYAALAVAAAVLGAVCARLAAPLHDSLDHLFPPHRTTSLFASRTRSFLSLAVLAALGAGYSGYLVHLSRIAYRSQLLNSDPIVSFLRASTDVVDEVREARLREIEDRARANYPRGRAFDRRNVVIIIVDSLRADHMQVYGYERPTTPFLASLQASNRLRTVEFATSACAESNCGILGTLGSKLLPQQMPGSYKLHDVLRDQGYTTHFILSGNHDWYGLKEAYGRNLSTYFDGTDSKQYSSNDDRVIAEGLERVPTFAGTPAFFYIHLMSTQLVGTKQDRYRVYHPSDVLNDWSALFSGRYDPATVVNNYDNGVTQADAVIQEVFQTLERKGYLANSHVTILSDHGEGLADRSRAKYGHVTSLFQEFIRIPLLFYDTPDAQYANLQFATQIDVAPTIADRLGMAIPESWRGRSLATQDAGAYSFHQTRLRNPAFAVLYRTGSSLYKYMLWSQTGREELYELVTDPGEQRNLAPTADPQLVQHLRNKLEDYRAQ